MGELEIVEGLLKEMLEMESKPDLFNCDGKDEFCKIHRYRSRAKKALFLLEFWKNRTCYSPETKVN